MAAVSSVRLAAPARDASAARRVVALPSRSSTSSRRSARRMTIAAASKNYNITLLPGDGIGPEIMAVAKTCLVEVGSQHDIAFDFTEALVGGAAIDATGIPLPPETLATCQASDAVLLAAIGGYKWDTLPAEQRPEQGLLGLRAGLGVFANLRPANILPQLIDASSLKREVVEGTDIMVIRRVLID
jgi:3-isopropylmalate dehydrogenase